MTEINNSEIWRTVEAHPKYLISNRGNIKINHTNKYVCTPLNPYGYRFARITVNKKSKDYTLHRLVALAFIPNPENKPSINHINGIPDDNRVENLEWCNASENQKHAYANGLRYPKRYRPVFDEVMGIFYSSIKEAAEAHGLKQNRMAVKIRNNKTSIIYI